MVSAATPALSIPAISVIVPNYRHAPYLPRRIESILNQTRGDFELLILDDCSPDNSREVIERYTADPRVRSAFNTVNSGNTFLQWRKGLSLTSAPYVWVAESDDFSDLHFLERLSAKLDTDATIGLAFCETMTVDAQDRDIAPYFDYWRDQTVPGFDPALLEREFVMPGRDFVRDAMVAVNPIPNASAVLFRRSAIEKIGGPVDTMRLCGDWLTYAMILQDHAVAHVPERMNFFRDHQGNVRSTVKGSLFLDETYAVRHWIEKNVGPPPADVRRYLRRFYGEAVVNVAREDDAKVSIGRVPFALRRAAALRPDLVPVTAALLARELASSVLGKLGLRRR